MRETVSSSSMENRKNGSQSLLLQPFRLAGLALPNRVVVAPMTRVSATPEGVPTPRMVEYYAKFAAGGFGLIITEGTYPDHEGGQGYTGQPGLVTPEQAQGWRQVTDAVHRAGGVIFAQIMHAGALSQALEYTIAPSAVQPKGKKMQEYYGEGLYPVPRAMSTDDIRQAIESFARAAVHAREAGFDGVEIHGANGYLVDQFLTTYTNQRSDEYGGDVAKRVRFAAEVVRAVKAAAGADFPVGIRLSQTKVNDFQYRWPGGQADGEVVFAAMRDAGASYLHLASEGRDWWQTARWSADGPTITELARRVSGLPVIANGGMHQPALAEDILRQGHGDLVSLGRGALANSDWPARLRSEQPFEEFDNAMIHPSATIENTDRWRAAREEIEADRRALSPTNSYNAAVRELEMRPRFSASRRFNNGARATARERLTASFFTILSSLRVGIWRMPTMRTPSRVKTK